MLEPPTPIELEKKVVESPTSVETNSVDRKDEESSIIVDESSGYSIIGLYCEGSTKVK
jgi:hypothetical protein